MFFSFSFFSTSYYRSPCSYLTYLFFLLCIVLPPTFYLVFFSRSLFFTSAIYEIICADQLCMLRVIRIQFNSFLLPIIYQLLVYTYTTVGVFPSLNTADWILFNKEKPTTGVRRRGRLRGPNWCERYIIYQLLGNAFRSCFYDLQGNL